STATASYGTASRAPRPSTSSSRRSRHWSERSQSHPRPESLAPAACADSSADAGPHFHPATAIPTIALRTLARYTRRCVASPAVAQVLPESKGPDWTRSRWPGRGAAGAEVDCGRVPAPPGAHMPTFNAGHDGRHGQNGYEEGK